jgi:hypothetical protein
MANRRHYKGYTPTESQYIKDLARIMENGGKGPFSRKYLAGELQKIYKSLSIQECNIEVSSAIESDKHINKRFKRIIPGGYVLAEKNPDTGMSGRL